MVVRGFHLIVWHNHTAHAVLTSFNRIHCRTFFIQQVRRDWHRNNGVNFLSVLFQRFFFDQTQNRERQRFVVTHGTSTGAARADVMAGFTQ